MVKYKNKLQPWKYFVVLPVARNPIKISSPNLSQLKPVHEGIRRVLVAQQKAAGRSRDQRHDQYDSAAGDYHNNRDRADGYDQRGTRGGTYDQRGSHQAYDHHGAYGQHQQQQQPPRY